MELSEGEFNKLIPTICSKETSSHPDEWNQENPTQGHCAIVSVLAQDLFGGEIIKVSLKGTTFEKFKSHFFNKINGEEVDFTISQFSDDEPYKNASRSIESKDEILSYPGTQKRFGLLKSRFANI